MRLKDKILSLPDTPGIYQYFDKNGRLLYIGKAKNLKKRVKSYFRIKETLSVAPNLGSRIRKMVQEIVNLEYIVVESEHDALILENSLIKQLKPKYNILLRDDKTYPYIYVDLNEDFPRLEITRKVIKGKKIKYFGPYSQSASDILNAIYETCNLVQKRSCIKGKKACLFHQIGKCPAPCENKITKNEYAKILQEALRFLQNPALLVKKLEIKMQNYSQNLHFEEAARIRDAICKIESSKSVSNIDIAKLKDYDVFAVEISKTKACCVMIFIREGKVTSSSHTIFKSSTGFDKDELYKRAFLNYYQKQLPYKIKEILVLEDFSEITLIEEMLKEKFKNSCKITIPKIGEKKRVVNLALKNAKEILRLSIQKDSSDIYEDLKKVLNLQNTPFVIEAYDNSHMQSQAIVGAIVKYDGGFKKEDYRRYNLEAKDEYAQMRELINRRVAAFKKISPPDLMLIDGGETLRKLAEKIVKKSGVYVDIVAIAKEKRDAKAMRSKGGVKDIIYTKDGVLKLSAFDKRLHFLQRLRDEAHRFAVSFHQKQKRKSDQEISLLQKKGVGDATVKKLLQYFETFENIQNATTKELSLVVGMNIAQNIKNIS